MYIIRYVTDKGTRQSEPVETIESARYLRSEILGHHKPQEAEIVLLSSKGQSTKPADEQQATSGNDNKG